MKHKDLISQTAATIANSWNPALGEEIGGHLGAKAVELAKKADILLLYPCQIFYRTCRSGGSVLPRQPFRTLGIEKGERQLAGWRSSLYALYIYGMGNFQPSTRGHVQSNSILLHGT